MEFGGKHNFSEIVFIYLQYKTLLIKLKLNGFRATSRGVADTRFFLVWVAKIMHRIIKFPTLQTDPP